MMVLNNQNPLNQLYATQKNVAAHFYIDVFRTGTYDVYDDESYINGFSSDCCDVNGQGLFSGVRGS